MGDLGIIPELERDCMPLAGESVVTVVDREGRRAYVDSFSEPLRWVPWTQLRTRTGEPLLSHRDPTPGDIVRATPARDYRLRICLDAVDGPIWLRLLAQLGYAVGVAGDECYGIGDAWASVPRTPETALRMGRRRGMSDDWMRRQLWGE